MEEKEKNQIPEIGDALPPAATAWSPWIGKGPVTRA